MAKTGRKDKGPFRLGLIVIGVVVGIIVGVFLIKFSGTPTKIETPVVKAVPPLTGTQPDKTVVLKPAFKIAIVIDDMGSDLKKLNELFEVDAPLTVAVLPFQRYSKAIAMKIHLRKGWEVILHMPMEPKGLSLGDPDKNPGKGALLTSMSAREVVSQALDDIKDVPYVDGVNNHMGSKFTEDAVRMRAALNVMKQHKLYFLDSRTSASSIAGKLAREMGLRNADRNVFLDNTRDEKYIKGQLDELVSTARRKGTAIAIGHPYPETIAALKHNISSLKEQGMEVVKLSDLVK